MSDVLCGKCELEASIFCVDCEVSYCDKCMAKRHSKGAFSRHTRSEILLRPECDLNLNTLPETQRKLGFSKLRL